MALLYMEGFEGLTDYVDLKNTGVTVAGNSPITTSSRGGRCFGLNYYADYFIPYFPNSTDTFYIGFAINETRNPGVNTRGPHFRYGTTTQFSIYFGTDGEINFYRGAGATFLGDSTGTFVHGVWSYIVIKVKLHNTEGTVELWLDGIKEIDLTNQNTMTSATAKVNNVIFYQQSDYNTNYRYYDDIYIGDDSGTDMTDQVGECHIELVQPDANGTTNDWTVSDSGTSNYQMVDEELPDDDTTYVSSSTVTDKELYGCSSLTGTNIGGVHAVQVRTKHRKEDAGNRTFNNICRSGATESDGTVAGVSTSYKFTGDIFENNPNGGGNWSEAAVNAMEIGFEIAS